MPDKNELTLDEIANLVLTITEAVSKLDEKIELAARGVADTKTDIVRLSDSIANLDAKLNERTGDIMPATSKILATSIVRLSDSIANLDAKLDEHMGDIDYAHKC